MHGGSTAARPKGWTIRRSKPIPSQRPKFRGSLREPVSKRSYVVMERAAGAAAPEMALRRDLKPLPKIAMDPAKTGAARVFTTMQSPVARADERCLPSRRSSRRR
ncbi:MAG: hypothetical protein AAF192_05700 [Pseudomonadota bacterium]